MDDVEREKRETKEEEGGERRRWMQQASRRCCCWLRVTGDGGKSLRNAEKSRQTAAETARHGAGRRPERLAAVMMHFINEPGSVSC